jgi:hypothetical protein
MNPIKSSYDNWLKMLLSIESSIKNGIPFMDNHIINLHRAVYTAIGYLQNADGSVEELEKVRVNFENQIRQDGFEIIPWTIKIDINWGSHQHPHEYIIKKLNELKLSLRDLRFNRPDLEKPGKKEESKSQQKNSNQYFDVFISFRNEEPDNRIAEELYALLSGKGLKVFYSKTTIPDLGKSNFWDEIFKALYLSCVLVVIRTSPIIIKRDLNVKKEYREFESYIREDIRNGIENRQIIICWDEPFNINIDIPSGLKEYQAYKNNKQGKEKLVRHITVALENKVRSL